MDSTDSTIFSPGEERIQHLRYLIPALLIAFALRLYHISSQSIWVDEMLTLHSSGITSPLHPIDIFDNVHGALHSLILFLWTRIAGTSEFVLRLPSAIFSVLSIFAIYKLLTRLLGSTTALLALGLLVISPFHIWYAQEVRNYSMLLLFSALSLDSFFALLEKPEKKTFAKYVIFTFLGFLSNMSMTFLVIAESIFFFLLPRKLSFRDFVFANAFIVLLLVPWIWGMIGRVEFHRLISTEPYGETELLRGETTFTPLAIPYTFYIFSAGYSFGPSLRELHESVGLSVFAGHIGALSLAGIVFILAGVFGLFSLWERKRLLAVLILWIGVPLLLVSFFAVKNFKPFNPRYVMVAFPAYIGLVAEGIRRAKPKPLSWLFLGGILSVMVLSLWNHYETASYGKEDFRSAGKKLKEDSVPGDAIFAWGTHEPLIYYRGRNFPINPLFPDVLDSDEKLLEFIKEKSRDKERVWLVTSRLWNLDPQKKMEKLFGDLFVFENKFSFEGVDLFLFGTKGL